MLMSDGPLQILFYALPPHSQHLIFEPGNASFLMDFDVPIGPRGCFKSKSQIKNVLQI